MKDIVKVVPITSWDIDRVFVDAGLEEFSQAIVRGYEAANKTNPLPPEVLAIPEWYEV